MKLGIDRLGLLLHDATRAVRKRFEHRAAALGLSSAQWRLLVHLAREERATQARLAELLEVEPISVSRLLDRMEQAGWVLREPDARDRRVRIVVPTPRTLRAYDDIRAMANEVYAEALSGLSSETRAALAYALNTIITNLADTDTDTGGGCPQTLKAPE